MSKLATALRLISSGDFRTFSRLAKDTVAPVAFGSRSVHVCDIRFRLLTKTLAETSSATDERELLLLQEGTKRRMRCIYDIAANVDLHSSYYSFLEDEGVAFEPTPDNYERLLRNMELNHHRDIRPTNIALSDSSGRAMFWDNGVSQTGRLVESPGRETAKGRLGLKRSG